MLIQIDFSNLPFFSLSFSLFIKIKPHFHNCYIADSANMTQHKFKTYRFKPYSLELQHRLTKSEHAVKRSKRLH